MLCINTPFQKRRGNLWTHTYPNGYRAQLDYMMINKKWINSVQNCKARYSLEGISIDHRIVSLRIKLSLQANKKKSNTKIANNWEHLINNEDLQNRFSTSLRNRYNILQHEDTKESANSAYQNFVKAHKETAEMLIPQKEKVKQKVPWENEITIEIRKQLKKLARMKNRNATRANVRKHKEAQKDLEATYFNEQQKYIQFQTDRIENAFENKQSSLAWQTVNEITGRKKSTKAKIKASNQEERLEKWMNHFQNLLVKSRIYLIVLLKSCRI